MSSHCVGVLAFLPALVGVLLNSACATSSPRPRRSTTFVAPLAAPPPTHGRVGVLAQHSFSGVRGVLGDSSVRKYATGGGAQVQVARFVAVRLQWNAGWGPTANDSLETPHGTPFAIGPGALFRTPLLSNRVRLYLGADWRVAVIPTQGERCTWGSGIGSFGPGGGSDRHCSERSWNDWQAHLHVELGARVWLAPERFALYFAGHIANLPLMNSPSTISTAGSLHAQVSPHERIEFNVGVGLRSGAAAHPVAAQFDLSFRVMFGSDEDASSPESPEGSSRPHFIQLDG